MIGYSVYTHRGPRARFWARNRRMVRVCLGSVIPLYRRVAVVVVRRSLIHSSAITPPLGALARGAEAGTRTVRCGCGPGTPGAFSGATSPPLANGAQPPLPPSNRAKRCVVLAGQEGRGKPLPFLFFAMSTPPRRRSRRLVAASATAAPSPDTPPPPVGDSRAAAM